MRSLRVGPVEILSPSSFDPDRMSKAVEVRLRGRAIDLSSGARLLLEALAGTPTRVFTLQECARATYCGLGDGRQVKRYADELRRALSVEGDELVEEVVGVGYRLKPE